MAEKKLSGKELVLEALKSYVKFLKNLEKSIEKARAVDEKAKEKLSIVVFGRRMEDVQKEFAKRIGFVKLAIRELEK